MALWDEFRPTVLQGLMAGGMTRLGTRPARSAYADTKHLRDQMEDDAEREQRKAEASDMADQENAVRREAALRDRRMAQIEGEPEQSYRTRLENQAWQPDKYGEAYRSQFKQANTGGTPTGTPTDEDSTQRELRRRRRLSMAGADY